MKSEGSSGVCEVNDCHSQSQYECPRCSISFCSVSCYQTHSHSCVSHFIRNEDEEGRGIYATDDERVRMRAILSRMEGLNHCSAEGAMPRTDNLHHLRKPLESDEESDNTNDSADIDGLEDVLDEMDDVSREVDESSASDSVGNVDDEKELDIADCLDELLNDISTMDLGFEETLSRLPKGLADDFRARVKDGTIGQIVPIWRPWWLTLSDKDGEIEPGDVEEEEEEIVFQWAIPRLPKEDDFDVTPTAARARASPAVIYSIVEVISSYCVTLRLCNGDWSAAPVDAALSLYKRSNVLSADGRFGNVGEAAVAFMGNDNSSWDVVSEGLADASVILRLSSGASRTLFDATALLLEGGIQTRAAARKTGFFAAWTAGSNPMDTRAVASELDAWLSRETKRRTLTITKSRT